MSVFGVKTLADVCDPDEFKPLAVASGEVPPGVEWVVTSMNVQRPNKPLLKDDLKEKAENAASEITDSASEGSGFKNPPEVKERPTVVDVSTELLGYDPTYLDEGYVYDFSVKVEVPLSQVLRGVDFSFGDVSGLAWKLLFDIEYDVEEYDIEYDVEDGQVTSYKFPPDDLIPDDECVVFTINFKFEFEWKLRRYLVILTDEEEKEDDWKTQIKLEDGDEESDVIIGKAENKTKVADEDPVSEKTKSRFE